MILHNYCYKTPEHGRAAFPSFGEKLRRARKAKHMTTLEAATALGLDYGTYSTFDSGRAFPDDDTLVKINRVFFN